MSTILGLTKSEFENTYKVLEGILTTPVDSIEMEFENPPTINDLVDSNKSYKITCAILFIDIRKSTDLSDSTHAKSMVKIYRSFMRMTVECVRDCGGVTRQFLGDRIMGVFMDEKDGDGKVIVSAVDKAVYAARCMETFIDYALNNLINKYVSGKSITCGIGISYGNVLVTQVGMRGVESDETKENEKDTVWVGKITNYASKYADLAQSGEIFIDSRVYKELSDNLKSVQEGELAWNEVTRVKGDKIYHGYVTTDFYVENVGEFGTTKFAGVLVESAYQNPYDKLFTSIKKQTSDLVSEISKESARLAKKEEELKQWEENLRQREKKSALLEENLVNRGQVLYYKYKNILNTTYCKSGLISEMGFEYWSELIDLLFSLGGLIGKTPLQVKIDIACYAVGIYLLFERYATAYEYLLIQAEYGEWLTFNYEPVIKKIKTKHELVNIVSKRIDNADNIKQRKEYQEYLDEINAISIE